MDRIFCQLADKVSNLLMVVVSSLGLRDSRRTPVSRTGWTSCLPAGFHIFRHVDVLFDGWKERERERKKERKNQDGWC